MLILLLCRHMGDELPQSPAGIVVSVADKVDSLVGLIGAGCAPSASADPYGLRRTAVGLLQVLALKHHVGRVLKNRQFFLRFCIRRKAQPLVHQGTSALLR